MVAFIGALAVFILLEIDFLALILLIVYVGAIAFLLTLGAHAHSEGYSSCRVCMYVCVYVCVYECMCVCVCVTTHNCRLTHWNHKTEIPTCSQQYSDRFKFCRFS